MLRSSLRSNLLLGVLALSAAPIAPSTAQAQEAGGMVMTSPAQGTVGPGARVRLWGRNSSKGLVGFVDALRADTLFLAGSSLGPLEPIPLEAIERLELNVRFSSRSKGAGKGAAIGGVTGGVVGFAIGKSAEDDCGGRGSCFEGLETLGAVFTGVLVGALLGGAIGAAESGDRWTDVPVGDLRMSPETERVTPVVAGLSLEAAGMNPVGAGLTMSPEVEQ